VSAGRLGGLFGLNRTDSGLVGSLTAGILLIPPRAPTLVAI